ncbi:MAG: cytochrome P450 [Anaerolineales bacterium]
MTSPAATGFNPFDPAFLEDPFPFYRIGRQAMPVTFLEPMGLWLAFGYNDCVEILKNHNSFSSAWAAPEGEPDDGRSMLNSDPPDHTRLRGLVSQAFTPRMVEQLEPRIRQITTQLLDAIAGQREADIVAALTYPLPVIVIAEILGIPPEDRDRFKYWSDEVVRVLGTGAGREGGEEPVNQQVQEEMIAYFTGIIEARRAAPQADLVSGLVRASDAEGSKLTTDELLQMLVLLLVAGNETTTNLIGNAIQEFMEYPDQLALVQADPSLVAAAVEETLRHSSPVQATVRRMARAATLGGKEIAAGDEVIVLLGSANRDESVYPDAELFDIRREQAPRHLAFGLGVHFCLGAPLAAPGGEGRARRVPRPLSQLRTHGRPTPPPRAHLHHARRPRAPDPLRSGAVGGRRSWLRPDGKVRMVKPPDAGTPRADGRSGGTKPAT